MAQVGLAEAQSRLPELFAAALRGEEIIIGQEGGPAVRLAPLPSGTRPGLHFGSAKGKLIHMAEDFDAPLEDFREYME